jgi:hypothetical protein
MYISSKMDTWQDKRMKAMDRALVNKKNYHRIFIEEYVGVSNSKHKTKQEYKREMYK